MKNKDIILTWTHKSPLYEYENNPYIKERGLYVISRIWGENNGTPRKERILYIGKSSRSFKQRLDDHTSWWTKKLRGNMYVRFACLQVDDDTLEDLESALIYECQPQENTAKMSSYSLKTGCLYRIENRGFRGMIPRIVDASEQIVY